MGSLTCPLCGKQVSDLLKHIRFIHNILDAEQFNSEIGKLGAKKSKQAKFAKFVSELQTKKRNSEITAEEFRELITKWIDQNRNGV